MSVGLPLFCLFDKIKVPEVAVASCSGNMCVSMLRKKNRAERSPTYINTKQHDPNKRIKQYSAVRLLVACACAGTTEPVAGSMHLSECGSTPCMCAGESLPLWRDG